MGILGSDTTDQIAGFAQNYYANFRPSAEDIKGLQQILAGAGHNPGPVDGVFGPKTLAALNAWQRQNNLPLTSTYDGTAKRQVDEAMRAISAPSTPNLTGGIAGALSGAPAPAGGAQKVAAGLSGAPAPSAPSPATTKIAEGLAAGAANPPTLAAPTASSNYGAGGVAAAPGTAGPVSSAPAPLPAGRNYAAMSDAELNRIIETEFGALAWYIHVPELVGVIRGAIREGVVDPNVIIGRVTKSEWWVNTVPAVREWTKFVHESGGPSSATVQEAIRRQVTEITKQAQITGVPMTPQRAWDLAVDSLQFGWTGDMVQKNILSDLNWNGAENLQGQVGVTAASLKRVADEYLIPISDGTLEKWTKDILGGVATEDSFRLYVAEQAKSLFPGLASAIDRGITVRQYVSPYQELAARELEMNAEDIDFNDPKWSKPLFLLKDGQPAQMSLAEWQTELRRNPTYGWQKTKAARAEASTFALSLLEDFGQIAR